MEKVEKGIPFPTKKFKKGTRFPFASMEVGDSFKTDAPSSTVTTAAWYFGKEEKPGAKFSVRKIAEGGVRCWRVE